MPSSSRSRRRDDEAPEPIPRRVESRRLRRTDNRMYRARNAEEKSNKNSRVHDPSAVSAASAATHETGVVSTLYRERRRSPMLPSSTRRPATGGNFLVEVSAIPVITNEENTDNNLEVAGWNNRGGISGGASANHRSVDGSVMEGLPATQTSERGPLAPANAGVMLMSPSVLGRRKGDDSMVTARALSRSPVGRASLDPDAGERTSEDDSRLPGPRRKGDGSIVTARAPSSSPAGRASLDPDAGEILEGGRRACRDDSRFSWDKRKGDGSMVTARAPSRSPGDRASLDPDAGERLEGGRRASGDDSRFPWDRKGDGSIVTARTPSRSPGDRASLDPDARERLEGGRRASGDDSRFSWDRRKGDGSIVTARAPSRSPGGRASLDPDAGEILEGGRRAFEDDSRLPRDRKGDGSMVTARAPPRPPAGRASLDPDAGERLEGGRRASGDDSRFPWDRRKGDGSMVTARTPSRSPGDRASLDPDARERLEGGRRASRDDSRFPWDRKGDGSIVTARAPSSSPAGRASLDPDAGEILEGGRRAFEDDSRLPWDRSVDDVDTRPDHSRNGYQRLSKLPASPLESVKSLPPPPPPPPPDMEDMYCIRFHQPVLLRGIEGRYLRVRKEEEDIEEDFDDNASTTTAATTLSVFGLGGGDLGTAAGGAADGGGAFDDRKTLFGVDAEGIGIGDPAEVVSIISCVRRHDRGPIKYGESVVIKSMQGKRKLLRASSSGTVVFARIHPGRNERWTILPHSSTSRRGATDLEGMLVRKGDRIELEHTVSSGLSKGAKVLLMICPRLGDTGDVWEVAAKRPDQYGRKGHEALEVAPAGVPYLPSWRMERRYVTGGFLLDPPPAKPSQADATLFGIEPREVERIEREAAVGGAGVSEYGSGAPLPEAMQEELILNDLLYALMGIPGSYVVVKGVGGEEGKTPMSLSELEFTINRRFITGPLASSAERMLLLCSNYVRIKRFTAERSLYEFGKVAHALAAGMQRMLREYLILIAKLEKQLLQGKLSLQSLWYYLQPSMRTMDKLAALTVELREYRGGEMLRCMTNLAGTGGDEDSRQLYTFLLHQASVPYLEMLETWIYHGDLDDHYGEFMIGQVDYVDKRDVGEDFNTNYWSGRYLMRPRNVIASLDSRQDRILTTGKYLNVVRECGRQVDCPIAGPIPADPGATGEGLYAKVIDGAYRFASRCLMDLIVREGELLPRLESIKHYFLLDRGDFFEHFLDCAEGELDKIIPQISLTRLESLLHLSVQMSSASQDPFKDDLGVVFSNQNLLKHLEIIHRHGGDKESDAKEARKRAAEATLAFAGASEYRDAASVMPGDVGGDYVRRIIQGTEELRGVESLMMSYTVRWPLSLVLSKKSLTKYQLLFRHIFFAKHVLRLLHKRLMDHQEMKQLKLEGLMGQSYHLRQRMVHFMQSIVYYMMVKVIEPRWHEFMDDMRRMCGEKDGEEGETLDDILKRHNDFLDTCLTECLLTNVGLLKSLTKVMISCLHFGDEGERFAEKRRLMEMQQEEEEKEEEEVTEKPPGARGSIESASGGPEPRSLDVRNDSGVAKGLSGQARTVYVEKRSGYIRAALDSAEYRKFIEQARDGFDASLHVFTGHLLRDAADHSSRHSSHLSNLFALLDYNGFFTSKYTGAG